MNNIVNLYIRKKFIPFDYLSTVDVIVYYKHYRGRVRNLKLWVHFLLICKKSTFLWNCGSKCFAPIAISSKTVGKIAPTAPTLTPPLTAQYQVRKLRPELCCMLLSQFGSISACVYLAWPFMLSRHPKCRLTWRVSLSMIDRDVQSG